jgi:phosphate transport system substrate-binding protein
VELRSFDGTVELEGNLIAYDGAYYQIDTIYGPLTVSAEGVSCAGPGCPDLTSFVAEAYIAGPRPWPRVFCPISWRPSVRSRTWT